jgi:[acyl-carrier-protein] S-malonyltransferase
MTDSLAFVFPGQGSQSLGMLAELAELHPLVHDAFREASDGAGEPQPLRRLPAGAVHAD